MLSGDVKFKYHGVRLDEVEHQWLPWCGYSRGRRSQTAGRPVDSDQCTTQGKGSRPNVVPEAATMCCCHGGCCNMGDAAHKEGILKIVINTKPLQLT